MNALRLLTIALAFALAATVTFGSPAGEDDAAAMAEKPMVTDPTTGKQVTAPEYGGTLTVTLRDDPPTADTVFNHLPALVTGLVLEKLGIGDWGVSRDKFDFRSTYLPDDIIVGRLAERWERPDPTTIVMHIRQGVNWHDKAPMNGRALTAKDVEFSFHRFTGLGSGYTEPPEGAASVTTLDNIGLTSITAEGSTVVFRLAQPNLDALKTLLMVNVAFIYPPEVIREHGEITDWRNLVGTGPYELTDWVEGSSVTWEKAPSYWGFDEKFPENRLPYIDTINALVMPEAQTRMAALRSGKVDFFGFHGISQITSIDQVESLKRTNPDIVAHGASFRSETSPLANATRPPFDDVRVRHALQMALDVEGAGSTYFKGYASTEPQGLLGNALYPYINRYEDWPAEVKGYYAYDPAGAEKLLDEAGLPRGADGTRFDLEFLITARDDRGWKEIIAAFWEEIGIDVTLTVVDGPTMGARRSGDDYDVVSFISGYEWNPVGELINLQSGVWGTIGGNDEVYKEMVARVVAEPDREEQQRLAREASDYVNRQHWIIWGARVPYFTVHWPWVKGYNGESDPGDMDRILVYSRLWIDQDLKREMGF